MQSVKNSCYSHMYNDEIFQKVSGGPTLKNNFQGIFLQGQSILNNEIEHAKNIPENNRIFYKNHILNTEGEGEPHGPNQEIIIEQHNIKAQKVRKT